MTQRRKSSVPPIPKSPAGIHRLFAGLLKDLGQPVPANQKAQAAKAQEFYLAALDAPTKTAARKLLEQALAIAPDHADANLALMDLTPVDPATRLERLRALVAA